MKNRVNQPETATDLRGKAERIAREKTAQPPKSIENMPLQEMQRLLHELQVHQIELELQNEELHRSQIELDAIRERYFELFDLAPVGYCTLTENGLIQEANLTAGILLGVPRGSLIRQAITRFICKEDQDIYYLHRKRLFETGEPQVCELRMRKKEGGEFWAHLQAAVAQTDASVPICRIVIIDITDRKRSEEATRALLREKELLLREINHRVKNNLQVISSLLSLQMGEKNHPSIINTFVEAQMRIQSMVLIHESLYQSDDLSRIDLAEFIQDLVTHLWKAYPIEPERIVFDIRLENVCLDINVGVPCGLLINELVSNALKYAFPHDRKGIIRIRLTHRQNKRVSLSISDNGIGFPEQIDPLRLESTGMQIITTLTEQLGGTIRYDRTRDSSRFTIDFTP